MQRGEATLELLERRAGCRLQQRLHQWPSYHLGVDTYYLFARVGCLCVAVKMRSRWVFVFLLPVLVI